MGTSQRIKPGVKGSPNWTDLSRTVTYIAKTVEKEQELEEVEDKGDDVEEENVSEKFRDKLVDIKQKRENYIHAAVRLLVKTGGGKPLVVSGKSNSFGKAGINISRRITSFFSDVESRGLKKALDKIGLKNAEGKTAQEIVDFLVSFCSSDASGLDQTAANYASYEVLNELLIDIDTFEEIEMRLGKILEGKDFTDLLCKFFGYYIYEHLSQLFKEKLSQNKTSEITEKTFDTIKSDIMNQVEYRNSKRSIKDIDWAGKEGSDMIEEIFDSLISMF